MSWSPSCDGLDSRGAPLSHARPSSVHNGCAHNRTDPRMRAGKGMRRGKEVVKQSPLLVKPARTTTAAAINWQEKVAIMKLSELSRFLYREASGQWLRGYREPLPPRALSPASIGRSRGGTFWRGRVFGRGAREGRESRAEPARPNLPGNHATHGSESWGRIHEGRGGGKGGPECFT